MFFPSDSRVRKFYFLKLIRQNGYNCWYGLEWMLRTQRAYNMGKNTCISVYRVRIFFFSVTGIKSTLVGDFLSFPDISVFIASFPSFILSLRRSSMANIRTYRTKGENKRVLLCSCSKDAGKSRGMFPAHTGFSVAHAFLLSASAVTQAHKNRRCCCRRGRWLYHQATLPASLCHHPHALSAAPISCPRADGPEGSSSFSPAQHLLCR